MLRYLLAYHSRSSAVLLLVGAAALGGCASYMPARFPTAAELAPVPEGAMPIQNGSHVRVELNDGTSVSGIVSQLTQSDFVVERVGNYGREERRIRKAEVASLEVEKSSRAANYLGSAVGVASVLFLALLVAVAAAI